MNLPDQSELEAIWVLQRGNIHTQPDRHAYNTYVQSTDAG